MWAFLSSEVRLTWEEMVEVVVLFGGDEGNLFLVIVASMLGCFHLCWPLQLLRLLLLLSLGKELRTSGLWEEKLLFGFESWRDSTSRALNFNGLREIKRWRLREGRREEKER